MPLIIIILLIILAILLIALCSIEIKKKSNTKIPENGINESLYIDVNGTKQWINIYGKDLNNPVILYLHGGPGISPSMFSYAITRKWSDVYTVVTWDQRNCGKSYCQKMDTVEISNETVLSDAMVIVDHVREHLHKDKITILGHSWGSMLGARLALEHPERFDTFIGTAQLIDLNNDEARMFDEIKIMAKDNKEDLELIDKLESMAEPNGEYFKIRDKLLDKYGQNFKINRCDLNIPFAMLTNPYYSATERRKSTYLKDCKNNENNAYFKFISAEETKNYFSLKDVKEFPIPYYNINGGKDHVADYRIAQEFFDRLDAPSKKMYIMKDVAHWTLLEGTEEFSRYIHEIAGERKKMS